MHTSKLISSALLISGLFLSHNTTAQSERSANDNRADVQRPHDGSSDGTSHSSILPLALGFEISGHQFRVSGGEPGAMCGIMIGFERDSVLLPSGSFLYLKPAMIFGIGRFDSDGRYELSVGYDAKMLLPIEYHFQAISLEGEDPQIRTSELRTLDFTNLGGDDGTVGTSERAAGNSGSDQGRRADGDVGGDADGDVNVDASSDASSDYDADSGASRAKTQQTDDDAARAARVARGQEA